MSELLWFMGDRDLARRLFHEASELKKRFNDRFWMPDKKFFALGLDAKRRQIRSISSNPGHLLASGIVYKDLARNVARRLLQPDMFSGWGVRTLSSDHPAYDPYSYHRGSVWPVEHGSFAMGICSLGSSRNSIQSHVPFSRPALCSITTGFRNVIAGILGTPNIRFLRFTPKRTGRKPGRHRACFRFCKPCWVSILFRLRTCCCSIHIYQIGFLRLRFEIST